MLQGTSCCFQFQLWLTQCSSQPQSSRRKGRIFLTHERIQEYKQPRNVLGSCASWKEGCSFVHRSKAVASESIFSSNCKYACNPEHRVRLCIEVGGNYLCIMELLYLPCCVRCQASNRDDLRRQLCRYSYRKLKHYTNSWHTRVPFIASPGSCRSGCIPLTCLVEPRQGTRFRFGRFDLRYNALRRSCSASRLTSLTTLHLRADLTLYLLSVPMRYAPSWSCWPGLVGYFHLYYRIHRYFENRKCYSWILIAPGKSIPLLWLTNRFLLKAERGHWNPRALSSFQTFPRSLGGFSAILLEEKQQRSTQQRGYLLSDTYHHYTMTAAQPTKNRSRLLDSDMLIQGSLISTSTQKSTSGHAPVVDDVHRVVVRTVSLELWVVKVLAATERDKPVDITSPRRIA